MKTRSATAVAFVAAGLLAVPACGSRTESIGGFAAPAPMARHAAVHPAAASCPDRSNFELSLVSGLRGEPTPLRAAMWFARHGDVAGVPLTGWRVVSRTGSQALAKSGPATVHVIEGPDRTWQVDSGSTCA